MPDIIEFVRTPRELRILDEMTAVLDAEGLGKWLSEAFQYVCGPMGQLKRGMILTDAEAVQQGLYHAIGFQSVSTFEAREKAKTFAEILSLFD